MKTCETCGHEYLDSYASCPFCARAATEPVAAPVLAPTPKRIPYLGLSIAGAAMLILVVGAWQLFFAYYGGKAVMLADTQRCFAKQIEVERAAMVYSATHDDAPLKSLADLVPTQYDKVPECTSGGTYTLRWLPQQPKVTCSKHGWHGDEQR